MKTLLTVIILVFSISNVNAQFCHDSGTTPPDYGELTKYLKTHSTPCPSESRGKWAQDQFRRLGSRIEELHREKPREAVNLLTEYNNLLSPYIVTESYTGFKDDKDFMKCLNFLYSVDNAIDKIRQNK